jgi:hypothetical protein
MERPGARRDVTARGNERKAIYRDDRDREHFCQSSAVKQCRDQLQIFYV